MDQVRDVCSAGSALRKGASLRNRLPLSTMTVVVAGADRLAGFEEIVADELNVKSVRLLDADHPDAASYGVSQRLTVNARAAGPRLGKDVQTAIRASKSGDWSVSDAGEVTAGGLVLQEGEFTLETVASGGEDAATGMLPGGGFVVLDTAVTPELEAEGVARDLVRAVQQARARRRARGVRPDRADRVRRRGHRRGGAYPRRPDPARDPRDVVRRRGGRRERAGHRAEPGLRAAGWMGTVELDLTADVVALTAQLVDIASVSHDEQAIADAVEAALRPLTHLTVTRHGHTVVARTDLGRGERVVLAGHLDTVPLNDNLPSRNDGTHLHGLGSLRHEGRRRGHPAAGRDRARAGARRDLRALRLRGGRERVQRSRPARVDRPGTCWRPTSRS